MIAGIDVNEREIVVAYFPNMQLIHLNYKIKKPPLGIKLRKNIMDKMKNIKRKIFIDDI